MEVTSIKSRVLASSYARYGVSAERQGLDVTWTSVCGGRLHSDRNVMFVGGFFLTLALLTAPPACHLLTLTLGSSESLKARWRTSDVTFDPQCLHLVHDVKLDIIAK